MKLENFFRLGVDDQNQYYGKTYFQVVLDKDQKERTWIWCLGMANRNIAKIIYDPAHMGDIRMVELTKSSPDLSFPATGLYNLKNSTIFVQRIPARQAKKGLCKETGQFRSFQGRFGGRIQKIAIPNRVPEIWSLKSIQEMFSNPHKFTLADAMIFFKKNQALSFAVDLEFGLSLGIDTKYLSLWYKQILIGEVPSPKEIVLKSDCMFKQEVVDRFLPEGIKIGVEK